MLQYLSNKFYKEPEIHSPEPRAALFLNRFSRTSTIMFATDGLATILGLQPSEVIGKSFYYCIEENCLQDAVKAIESAKANDSLAYLRFWYRNPLQEDNRSHNGSIGDDDEDEEGGVALGNGVPYESSSSESLNNAMTSQPTENGGHLTNGPSRPTMERSPISHVGRTLERQTLGPSTTQDSPPLQNETGLTPPTCPGLTTQRSSTDQSADTEGNARDAIFDRPATQRSSSSATPPEDPSLEIEAVISCSSDGLVLVLRRARPFVPHTLGATETPYYANGLFATPWATEPVQAPVPQEAAVASTARTAFPGASSEEAGFMAAIRDVAVFAWGLTGINGSLMEHARGTPGAEAVPPDGLPVWDPTAQVDPLTDENNNGFLGSRHRPWAGPGGEPSETRKDEALSSSDDEVVWKRAPTMSAFRRPKRRAHEDAFGADGHDGGDGQNQHGGRKRATRSNAGSGRASGSADPFSSGSGFSSGSN